MANAGPTGFDTRDRSVPGVLPLVPLAKVNCQLLSAVQLGRSGVSTDGEIAEHPERRGITVLLKGVRAEHLRILEAVGSLDRLAHEHHVFDDLPSPVDHVRRHVDRSSDHDAA